MCISLCICIYLVCSLDERWVDVVQYKYSRVLFDCLDPGCINRAHRGLYGRPQQNTSGRSHRLRPPESDLVVIWWWSIGHWSLRPPVTHCVIRRGAYVSIGKESLYSPFEWLHVWEKLDTLFIFVFVEFVLLIYL